MTRHIHFCNIGLDPEPTLAVCKTEYPPDKIYLINSYRREGDDVYARTEEIVRERLKGVNICDLETIEVDPYDMDELMERIEKAVVSECEQHRDCRFHFNITSGTNIAAGAMCVIAMSRSDTDMYHVKKDEFCLDESERGRPMSIELADLESVRMLESSQKEADLMEELSSGRKTNRELAGVISSPSLLSYHLKQLSSRRLIERGGSSPKAPVWSLTKKGEKVLRRYVIRTRNM